MTGNKKVTGDTYIRNLPYSAIRYMCAHLDTDELWRKFVVYIPKTLSQMNDQNDFEERYSLQKVRMFEDRGRKVGGSTTQCILNDWGTQNTQVKHLIKVFVKAKLFAMADYLSVQQMGGEPVSRGADQEDLSSDTELTVSSAAFSGPGQRFVGQFPPPQMQNGKSLNVDSKADYKPDMYDKVKVENHERREVVEAVMTASSNGSLDNESSLSSANVMYERMSSYSSGLPSHELEGAALPSSSISLPKPPPRRIRDNSKDTEKHNNQSPESHEKLSNSLDSPEFVSETIPYHQLRQYTNDFAEADISKGGNVIGCGGFGTVFLGVLPNGYKVAVKKLKQENDPLMEKQFNTELTMLSKLRHENIVRLIGFSVEGQKKCLVYEYMSNGSLEDRLCCYHGTLPLVWTQRIAIMQGTARGISFLNNVAKIVHRDVKSANVLLDENFTPKVGDFATVRPAPSGDGNTAASTFQVIGTSAYMAPEAVRFDVSAKLDSFAFGVVLLEVLTGLAPTDHRREESDLWSHIENNCDENDISEFLDKRGGDWDVHIANKLYDIAKQCLHEKKKQRALVSKILPDLEELLK